MIASVSPEVSALAEQSQDMSSLVHVQDRHVNRIIDGINESENPVGEPSCCYVAGQRVQSNAIAAREGIRQAGV